MTSEVMFEMAIDGQTMHATWWEAGGLRTTCVRRDRQYVVLDSDGQVVAGPAASIFDILPGPRIDVAALSAVR